MLGNPQLVLCTICSSDRSVAPRSCLYDCCEPAPICCEPGRRECCSPVYLSSCNGHGRHVCATVQLRKSRPTAAANLRVQSCYAASTAQPWPPRSGNLLHTLPSRPRPSPPSPHTPIALRSRSPRPHPLPLHTGAVPAALSTQPHTVRARSPPLNTREVFVSIKVKSAVLSHCRHCGLCVGLTNR